MMFLPDAGKRIYHKYCEILERSFERGVEFPSLIICNPWLGKALNSLVELAQL